MSRTLVLILGAGRPYRGGIPSALACAGAKRVLDWTLEAFSDIKDAEFHFLGGYRLEEVIRSYPQIHYSVNTAWETSGPLGTLALAPLSQNRCVYVSYSDVVFRSHVVERMERTGGDVVVVTDSSWRSRYLARSREDLESAEKLHIRDGRVSAIGDPVRVEGADAEFAGLLKLTPPAIASLRRYTEQAGKTGDRRGIPDLIGEFLKQGLDVRALDVAGDWAELNAPQDLARFILGTKAETLERLASRVRRSVIAPQVSFSRDDWSHQRDALLDRVRTAFDQQLLIVRSSALTEDGWSDSNAGAFRSVLNVPGHDHRALSTAIEEVIASYTDDQPGHQVLIQPMVSDVTLSGVVLTRTLNTAAPYYTICFDESSLSTDTVTSGSGDQLRTVVVHRTLGNAGEVDARLAGVIDAARELEELVGHDSLDIEFALSKDDLVHVLQLRPLSARAGQGRVSDGRVEEQLQATARSFSASSQAGPLVLGQRPLYGNMSDWNPAEIVGPKPRRLALSLYQYLITDRVWALQRAQYGYRDVRPCALLRVFAGHPYVDIRASFNSFVPATLPDDLAQRLVEHYTDRLLEHPQLHDKIEFDVVHTCLAFDSEARSRALLVSGLSREDVQTLQHALAKITRSAFDRLETDLAPLGQLGARFERWMNARLPPLATATALLADAESYGALAFAHAARAGFVAVSLLRSLEAVGVTTPADTQAFLRSLSTVARSLERDAAKVAAGRLEWSAFVSRYGHLRPGTYEITSPCYAAEPERYLRPAIATAASPSHESEWGGWRPAAAKEIRSQLARLGLPDDRDHFERFLRAAIESREHAKFVFTRNLSVALEQIAVYAEGQGLSRDQLSHLFIWDLMEACSRSQGLVDADRLADRAQRGLEEHGLTTAAELPPLLRNSNDLLSFEIPPSQPNFITDRKVVAPPIDLGTGRDPDADVRRRIVLIRQADPGFDWLFGRNIAGLVTANGGANSHMAIRCAEFGIPGAIGVGEILYEALAKARMLELDGSARRVRALR